jgi:hypothetical protein
MYLRHIQLRQSDLAQFQGDSDFVFHWTGHHVKEIFLNNLPRHYDLNGTSQITLICGPRPAKDHEYTEVLGTSALYIEDFDFERYIRAIARHREETILDVLESSFVRIATEKRTSVDVIREAAAAVRQSAFSLRLPIKKLSRSTSDRSMRIDVLRNLSFDDGEAWSAEVSDRTGRLLSTEWITPRPHYLDRTEHFSESRWVGNEFQILYGRLNRVEYRLDVTKYRGNENHNDR